MSDLTKAQRQRVEALQTVRDLFSSQTGFAQRSAGVTPLDAPELTMLADYVLTGYYAVLDTTLDAEVAS